MASALLARHFRRPFPIRSVAMNEVAATLGGANEIVKAVAVAERDEAPELIGLITGGINETRGDDLGALIAELKNRRNNHTPLELLGVSTPDFTGSLEDGWSRAVARLIETLAAQQAAIDRRQVALLPGSHLTPADVEALKAIATAFGMKSVTLQPPHMHSSVRTACIFVQNRTSRILIRNIWGNIASGTALA